MRPEAAAYMAAHAWPARPAASTSSRATARRAHELQARTPKSCASTARSRWFFAPYAGAALLCGTLVPPCPGTASLPSTKTLHATNGHFLLAWDSTAATLPPGGSRRISSSPPKRPPWESRPHGPAPGPWKMKRNVKIPTAAGRFEPCPRYPTAPPRLPESPNGRLGLGVVRRQAWRASAAQRRFACRHLGPLGGSRILRTFAAVSPPCRRISACDSRAVSRGGSRP